MKVTRLSVLEGESRRGVGLPRPGLTIHRFWAGQAHARSTQRRIFEIARDNTPFLGGASPRPYGIPADFPRQDGEPRRFSP